MLLIWHTGTVTYNVNVSNTLGFRDHFIIIDTFYTVKLVIRISDNNQINVIYKYRAQLTF